MRECAPYVWLRLIRRPGEYLPACYSSVQIQIIQTRERIEPFHLPPFANDIANGEWNRPYRPSSTPFPETCNLFVGMNWDGAVATAVREVNIRVRLFSFIFVPYDSLSVLSSFRVLSSCVLDDFFNRRFEVILRDKCDIFIN